MSESGDFEEVFAGAEGTIFVAPGDDFCCECGSDSGDVCEQWGAGGIQVNSDGIDARFDFSVEGFLEECLIDIVLVLSDTDGAGIDFDQFCERVLESVCDADSAANSDVEMWIFGDGDFAGRVDGGTGFADGDVSDAEVVAFQYVCDEAVCFAGGGTVADGDEADAVLSDEFQEDEFGVLQIFAWRGGEDGFAGEKLSGAVDDCQFASGAKSGVDADGDLLSCRCSHEEIAEISGEDSDSICVGLFAVLLQDGGFCGWSEQAVEAIGDGCLELCVEFEAGVFEDEFGESSAALLVIEFEVQFEDSFGFAALESEESVGGHGGDAFAEVEVVCEASSGFFLAFFEGGGEFTVGGEIECDAAVSGILGPCFGDDIAGSLQCRLFIGDVECRIFEASEDFEWFLLQW